MKKGAKVFGLIVILLIPGSAFVGVVTAEEIIIDTEKGESRFTTDPPRLTYKWWYARDHLDSSPDGWFDTKAYPPGQGNGNFWYTFSFPEVAEYKGIWETSLPHSGNYEVFVWIPSPDPFDPNLDKYVPPNVYLPTQVAKYKIFHKTEVSIVTIDQDLNKGRFTSLGVFDFGTTAKVELTNNQDEFWRSVAFDAVKFVPVAALKTPPYTPSSPSPATHATDQSIYTDLSWTGGDPDAGDTVTYDVYFGTSTSPLKVSTAQSGTTYDPGTLSYRTYYWKIKATDNHGASTTGPLWNFTTGSTPNQLPNTPTMLFQLKSDGVTLIPVGSETTENSVTFKGVVSDPDGDQVKLRVELRRLDEYGGQFDETQGGFKESGFLESGSEVVAYANDLIDADYHWRSRAVDEHGNEGEWEDFGNNDILDADFIVSSQNQPPVALFSYSPEKPKAGEWVTFDAADSYDPDGKIELYGWDLNNDGIYEECTPWPKIKCHWNKAGTYQVGLKVIDNNGASGVLTKAITVKTSFWDKVGDFFKDIWPWGEKVKKIEDSDLSIIEEKLAIDEWLPTTRFYWCTDHDLKVVLNQERCPEEVPGLTYGIYILNAIRETEMLKDVLSQQYKPQYKMYFSNWLDLNTGWSAVAKSVPEKALDNIIGKTCPIGGTMLSLALDSAKVGEVLVPLRECLFYNTLGLYFDNRRYDMSHHDAWINAHSHPWAGNYFANLPCGPEVEKRFNELWETYEEFLSDKPPP